MNLSTKILIGLGLGIIAGLELGAEGVDFAAVWGISKRSAVSAAKLWLIIWELRHLRLYLVYF